MRWELQFYKDKWLLLDIAQIPQQGDWIWYSLLKRTRYLKDLNGIHFEQFKGFKKVIGGWEDLPELDITLILPQLGETLDKDLFKVEILEDSWCDLHKSNITIFCSACQMPTGKCWQEPLIQSNIIKILNIEE